MTDTPLIFAQQPTVNPQKTAQPATALAEAHVMAAPPKPAVSSAAVPESQPALAPTVARPPVPNAPAGTATAWNPNTNSWQIFPNINALLAARAAGALCPAAHATVGPNGVVDYSEAHAYAASKVQSPTVSLASGYDYTIGAGGNIVRTPHTVTVTRDQLAALAAAPGTFFHAAQQAYQGDYYRMQVQGTSDAGKFQTAEQIDRLVGKVGTVNPLVIARGEASGITMHGPYDLNAMIEKYGGPVTDVNGVVLGGLAASVRSKTGYEFTQVQGDFINQSYAMSKAQADEFFKDTTTPSGNQQTSKQARPFNIGTGIIGATALGVAGWSIAAGKSVTDFFDAAEKGIDAGLPVPLQPINNFYIGVAELVPEMLVTLPLLYPAAVALVTSPMTMAGDVKPGLTQEGEQFYKRLQEDPARGIGNIAGIIALSYAGPKIVSEVAPKSPIGIQSAEVPTGMEVAPSATDLWVQGINKGSPVMQGLIDQFKLVPEFESANKYTFVYAGDRIVGGIARGSEITPQIFVGRAGLEDLMSQTHIDIPTPYAKYAPVEWTMGQERLLTPFLKSTAEDSFTSAMVDLNTNLARSERNLALSYKPYQLIGTAPQEGIDFVSSLKIQGTLGNSGMESIVVGSRSMVDFIGPQYFRDVTESDIDISANFKAQAQQIRELPTAYEGTDIVLRRNMVYEGDLVNKGKVVGDIDYKAYQVAESQYEEDFQSWMQRNKIPDEYIKNGLSYDTKNFKELGISEPAPKQPSITDFIASKNKLNYFDVSGNLPKEAPPPEQRGFSFGEIGEEHTLGTHPLEYNADIKGFLQPNIAGTKTGIQTPENFILSKLSRVVGAGSKAEKPSSFIYEPSTGETTLRLTGGKQVTDLADIYAQARNIAYTAYLKRNYSLGGTFEDISDAIAMRMQSELDTNIWDIIAKDKLAEVPKTPINTAHIMGIDIPGFSLGEEPEYPAMRPRIVPETNEVYPVIFRMPTQYPSSTPSITEYPPSPPRTPSQYPPFTPTTPPDYPPFIPPPDYPTTPPRTPPPDYPPNTPPPPGYPPFTPPPNTPPPNTPPPNTPPPPGYPPFTPPPNTPPPNTPPPNTPPPNIPPLIPIITLIFPESEWPKIYLKKKQRRFYRKFNEKIMKVNYNTMSAVMGHGAKLPYLETRKRGFLDSPLVIKKREARLPEAFDMIKTSQKMAPIKRQRFVNPNIYATFNDLKSTSLAEQFSKGRRKK